MVEVSELAVIYPHCNPCVRQNVSSNPKFWITSVQIVPLQSVAGRVFEMSEQASAIQISGCITQRAVIFSKNIELHPLFADNKNVSLCH